MNQPVPEELISAYFDGEVTPEERERVESLLETSVELRQVLDDTSKLSALLHSFPREAAPADLAVNVHDRVSKSTAAAGPETISLFKRYRRELMAFVIGTVATAATFVMLYFGINQLQIAYDVPQLADAGIHPMAESRYAKEFKSATSLEEKAEGSVTLSIADDQPSSMEQLALQESEGIPDSNNYLEPRPYQKYLEDLQRGDLLLQLDPNNSLQVVELSVVDVIKGAEEVMYLLQKRNLPQVDNNDRTLGNERMKDRALAMKPASRANDLIVIYARAPGKELAAALDESLQHPDVCRKLEARIPLPFPDGGVANLGDYLTKDNNVGGTEAILAARANDVANQDQTVANEGKVAVNLFANMNGLTVESSEESMDESKQKSDNPATTNAPAAPDAQSRKETAPNQFAAAKKSQRASEVNKNNEPIESGAAVVSSQEAARLAQGYSYFNLAVDNQQRQLPARSMTPAGAQSNEFRAMNNSQGGFAGNGGVQFGNNFNNPIMNNSITNGGNSIVNNNPAVQMQRNSGYRQQQRVNRQSVDVRDPQLVRMLIVLKAEQQPAAAASPQPSP